MKPVFLCSPLRAPDSRGLRKHLSYARQAMKHSISLGEAPYAPHLLYPQVLDDNEADERDLGFKLGNAWLTRCEALVIYGDLGISSGMAVEITLAASLKIPAEIRYIKSGTKKVLDVSHSPAIVGEPGQ